MLPSFCLSVVWENWPSHRLLFLSARVTLHFYLLWTGMQPELFRYGSLECFKILNKIINLTLVSSACHWWTYFIQCAMCYAAFVSVRAVLYSAVELKLTKCFYYSIICQIFCRLINHLSVDSGKTATAIFPLPSLCSKRDTRPKLKTRSWPFALFTGSNYETVKTTISWQGLRARKIWYCKHNRLEIW